MKNLIKAVMIQLIGTVLGVFLVVSNKVPVGSLLDAYLVILIGYLWISAPVLAATAVVNMLFMTEPKMRTVSKQDGDKKNEEAASTL